MNKLNFEEILDILKINLSVEEFAHYSDTSNMFNLGEMKGKYFNMEVWKGEDWYTIKYFKDHDIYIRVNGFIHLMKVFHLILGMIVYLK